MTAERWELVKSLFESALTVSVGERPSFLQERCGSDEEVRREVASLLESLDESGDFLEDPLVSVNKVVEVEPPPAPSTLIGTRIGAWEIVSEIGRGGMGAVYLAVRADKEFRQRVAIKLIRGGMETDFIIRRFKNERQILARLEHPNIARLVDGGTTADGLPYFVMEYVEGEPLIQYCESHAAGLRERLEILLKACSAVHYAHRRMIIHRDLKPGNILVKQDGTPKLLDFGIAKLLDPDTADGLAETTMGGFRIVTPAYASPEQMRGETATVRSDIYSLGVILYELITGRRPVTAPGGDPLALPDKALTESTRMIALQLRSVVHKSVQPAPEERYPSVEEFAADIQACLAGVQIPNYAAETTRRESTPISPGSVAVLPFRLLGVETTSQTYLGLGITDALITKLSNVGRISVRATSAVMKYAPADPLAAGRELGVEFVVEGRIQKIGDRVRVTVQLVNVATASPGWAASFDDQFEDLLRLEDSISEQVARALVPQLTGEERKRLARAGTSNPQAHQAYLRGRFHWNKGTDESLAQALLAFTQAIAEDPNYAGAHAGVADYYVLLGMRGGLPPSESFAAAKDAAQTALRIDSALGEAHAALGFALWAYDRDYGTAAHEFQLAIALNPDYAPAHHWLGLLNSARGRPEMAVACMERARKLDPNRAIYAADLALAHYNARRFKRAIDTCLDAIQTMGDDSELYSMLALSYRFDGQLDQALEAAHRAVALAGDAFAMCVLAEVEAARGDRAPARKLLSQVRERAQTAYVSGCVLALLHLACGDRDRALDELERAWRDRDWWINWLGVGPSWDELRSNARFKRLLFPHSDDRSAASMQPPVAEPTRSRPRQWRWAAAALATLLIVVAAILGHQLMQPAPTPFAKRTVTKLTTNGIAFVAALSPNGRYVAYTAGLDTRPTVWVRELNGNTPFRIAGPIPGPIRTLQFIRDSTYVSYIAPAAHDPTHEALVAVPIGGGSPETLMDDVPGPASISLDGSKVAYYHANPDKGMDDLYIRNTDGSGERRIASQRYPDRFSFRAPPMWSPDGRRLACAVEGSDPTGFRVALVLADLKGGIRPIASSPRWQVVGRLAWMRDSGLLVIGQEHNSSFQQIWYVPLKGEAVHVTNDLNDYQSLSAVADGSALVSVQFQTVTNVYLLWPNDPAHGTQITPGGGRYFDLAWTPDGKRIAYASDASGSADIWLMGADGSDQQQLTKDAGRNYSPAVSPDGKRLAFHSNRDGNWNLWMLDLDSHALTQLTRGTLDSNWPQFTPDGAYLVYHHTGLNAMFNIWKVPAAGGPATQVTSKLTMYPAVSPKDGRIACWYSDQVANPKWKLAIFAPDGTGPQQLFDIAPTVHSTLHWTPQGDAITLVDDRNGVSNIWLQTIDGKPLRPLTKFEWGTVFSCDWSADGRLAYSRGMITSDVVLIRDSGQNNGSGWVR